MQPIYDVLNAGGPFIKGILDFTTAMVTPAVNDKEVKKPLTKSTSTIVQKISPVAQFNLSRNWLRLGGLSGAAAIALGAYGAHIIERNDKFSEEQKRSYRSANLYHFFGTFGLVACSLSRFPTLSGSLMALGTFVFCGSCYYFGITGDDSIRKFAPYGGSTMIAAWLSLCL